MLTEVSTSVVIQSFGVLMDDIRSDFVQECTIVRNNQDSTGVTLKVVGKESNRRNVQHVRRFYATLASFLSRVATERTVKKKQIRLAEQGSGQAHSSQLWITCVLL